MIDFFNAILSHADAFRWLFLLALLLVFYRWMQSDDSDGIEWRDFISAMGVDGKYHGDLNKLGQITGIVVGSVSLVMVSANAKSDFSGFALVLASYFAFVGGVAGYAAYLRSKNTRMETTITKEPVAAPSPEKTTTTINQPLPKGAPTIP